MSTTYFSNHFLKLNDLLKNWISKQVASVKAYVHGTKLHYSNHHCTKNYCKQGQSNQCQTPGLNLKNKLEETGKTRLNGKKHNSLKKKTPKNRRNWMGLKETGSNRNKQE